MLRRCRGRSESGPTRENIVKAPSRTGAILGLLLLMLVCSHLGAYAMAEPCPGIASDTAQRVFDRIRAVDVEAGYLFKGLGTKESEMSVLWSRDGTDCPTIRIDVENCGSPLGLAAFRVNVPPELSGQCPGLAPVAEAISEAVADEYPVGQHLALPPRAERPFLVFVAVILGAGLAIRRLLRSASAKTIDWGDGAWIALVLGVAGLFHHNVLLASTLVLGTAWLCLGALLCDRNLLGAEDRARAASLLGLFAVALLVHWGLSSGGPGDLHLNLAAIWSNELDLRWGPAPIAGFRMLRLLMEVQDTAIVWSNLVASSLVPILVYGILAQLGLDRIAALAAALTVACHPVLIAFSGVLERQPAYLFAAFGSLLALIGFLKSGAGRYFAAFVVGTVLTATSRPEGAQVLILHIAAVLLVPANRRARTAVAIALALLATAAYLYVAHALDPKPLPGKMFSGERPFLWTILASRDSTPSAWIAAWMLGLIAGIRRRAAWLAVAALIGFDLAWRGTDLYHMFVGLHRHVAAARYQTLLLIPFAVGIALLAQTVRSLHLRLQVALAIAFVVATAATVREPYETLLRPFTADYEYRFLRKHAATLPPDSRLYVLDPPFDDMGFIDARFVGEFVRSPVRFAYWSERRCEDLRVPAGPAYLYIGSVCDELVDAPEHPLIRPAYERWLEQCATIRSGAKAGAVEEIDVPARKMSWHDFKGPTAHLGLYRIVDGSICDLGPPAAMGGGGPGGGSAPRIVKPPIE